ncbi:MAG: cytochrome d ubiquinol oxidase subunit II [Opitutales bacterium]|jgi:cytochrome d ubiquinol oxidase subunit II
MDLNIIWYVLIGVLLTGYAILDGFDFGVGALHLFHKSDEQRRISLNSIGPVWDGNEVWLVTGGGALFAAFPEVYATVFSGFYLALILVLFALIFRAVAIEFRSKQPMKWWRAMWDWSFAISSIAAPLLFGVAMGNMVQGIPLDKSHNYAGSFLALLNPYALLMGVTTVALFVMHGAIYLCMKTEGEMHKNVRRWIRPVMLTFIICYVVLTFATVLFVPHINAVVKEQPLFLVLVVVSILTLANIPREMHRGNDGRAFISSMATMAIMMTLFAASMFPYMVLSTPDGANTLDIYNAASSQKTLGIMLIIALIGMPMVLAYTFTIYWIFRGKVKLTPMSY